MCQQKNSDGASLREKVTRLDRPLTKNQPEMRSKGLVELSTMFNGSTHGGYPPPVLDQEVQEV